MDRDRLGEGFCFGEDLLVLGRRANDAHALATAKRQCPRLGSVQAEDRYLLGGSTDVGNKKAVARNRPLLDAAVAFGNYVNPFWLTFRPEPQFDDPQVRRVAVGDGQDSAAKEQRAETIVRVSDDAVRSFVALPRFQIEIRARFLQEAVDEEADPCRI